MSIMKKRSPFLIGVAGGVSSGKSSVCKKIYEQLTQINNENRKQVLIISFDSFYKKLTNEEQIKAQRGEHNYDHPSSFDDELAYRTIIDLINANTDITIPIYDHKTHSLKVNESILIKKENQPDVVIIEGILVFYYPKIRDLFHMKLFVDCDADTRLSRRVLRDMREYDRDLDNILNYYTKFVKLAFEEFCLPTKKYADVIIPRGAENTVAINLIVQHINDLTNNLSTSAPSSTITTTSTSINNQTKANTLANSRVDANFMNQYDNTDRIIIKRRKNSNDNSNNSENHKNNLVSEQLAPNMSRRNESSQMRPH